MSVNSALGNVEETTELNYYRKKGGNASLVTTTTTRGLKDHFWLLSTLED